MSNLGQFYGKGFPIGAQVTMAYLGSTHTSSDGSVWIAASPSSAFAYTSDYAPCIDKLTVNHPLMRGYWSGSWVMYSGSSHVAYKSSGTLTASTTLYGDATTGFTYATSIDNGVNWTPRTFPNTLNYTCLVFTGGKFVGYADTTAANGVITSTDAVTWSTVNGVAFTPQDIVSDGANNFVAIAGSGSTAGSSTDGGVTWAAATVSAFPNFSRPGLGVCTWNAGAGLFIGGTTSTGVYQTSPTGATWTLRNSQATFKPYSFGTTAKFASNSTTTVVVGLGGFFATTTDGLTWANHGFIGADRLGTGSTANALYYDGSRFVVIFVNGLIYHSSNGTSWTYASSMLSFSTIISTSSGVAFCSTTTTVWVPLKVVRVSNAASTTPEVVSCAVSTVISNPSAVYYRIK